MIKFLLLFLFINSVALADITTADRLMLLNGIAREELKNPGLIENLFYSQAPVPTTLKVQHVRSANYIRLFFSELLNSFEGKKANNDIENLLQKIKSQEFSSANFVDKLPLRARAILAGNSYHGEESILRLFNLSEEQLALSHLVFDMLSEWHDGSNFKTESFARAIKIAGADVSDLRAFLPVHRAHMIAELAKHPQKEISQLELLDMTVITKLELEDQISSNRRGENLGFLVDLSENYNKFYGALLELPDETNLGANNLRSEFPKRLTKATPTEAQVIKSLLSVPNCKGTFQNESN